MTWERIIIHNHPEQMLYRNGNLAVFVNYHDFYLLKDHKEVYVGSLTTMDKISNVLSDWERGIIYVELKM